MTFRHTHSTDLGGLYAVRAFAKMFQDAQANKAYKTKDQSDFEQADRARQTVNFFDALLGLLRLGR